MKSEKFSIIALGCPKNYVDSEYIESILIREGYEKTFSIEDADVVVINTCAFIDEAKEESIDTILEVSNQKKPDAKIVVAGCLVDRYSSDLPELLPEVFSFVGIKDISHIKDAVKERGVYVSEIQRFFYEGVKRFLSFPGYAYLRISDGCSRKCSFCAIPLIKGRHKSLPEDYIINEAEFLAEQGAKEIILVGQDITSYGIDLDSKGSLMSLIERISRIDEVKWIRLLYLYPTNLNREFFEFVRDNPKIVPYFDIPFQHASGKILKRMNRAGDKYFYLELLETIRGVLGENAVLRTSLITGFPGETEEDFEEMVDFVEKAQFDRLGVFVYSREEGTEAYNMSDLVDRKEAERRRDVIMEIQREISRNKMKKWVGKTLEVLVEGETDVKFGRSFLSAPEIDGKTFFNSYEPITSLIGEFVNVKITGSSDYDLYGEME